MTNAPAPITLDAGGVELHGTMVLPPEQGGLVVIPRADAGDGASAQTVARRLQETGLGTLILDLFTSDEANEQRIEGLVPDAALLGERLGAVLDVLERDDRVSWRPFGLYGKGMAAAAALVAASERPERIGAVVSRSGRPDLAGDALERVAAPTLLVVGEDDEANTDRNHEAARQLGAVSQIESLGRTTDLDQAIALATDWFTTHLVTLESPVGEPESEHPREMRPDRFPPRQGRVGPQRH